MYQLPRKRNGNNKICILQMKYQELYEVMRQQCLNNVIGFTAKNAAKMYEV